MLPSVALPPPPSASTYRPPPPPLGPPPSTNKDLLGAISMFQRRAGRRYSYCTAAHLAAPSWPALQRRSLRGFPWAQTSPPPNIAAARCLAALPRLITMPRVRRQDSHGCYLLAALATSGINFANNIACRLLYFRRPSAARPPPPTKSPKFANNGVACPASRASCSITCLSSLSTPPCSGSSRLLPRLDLICTAFAYYGARAAGTLLVCDVVAARPLTPPLAWFTCTAAPPTPLVLLVCLLVHVGSPAFYPLVRKHVHLLRSCAPEVTAAIE
ncbi:hypothetical protein B0H14DRAFT_3445815 [Mycena olivaceomarginata]|nr:hypothetical protein B0H14DRAFT_3445815 [Mycena olivaceomarginata]